MFILFTFLYVIRLFGTSINDWEEKKKHGEHFHSLVCCFFNTIWNQSCCQSRWDNLDRGQYRFQLIKIMNLVVPSPCETEPYNKRILNTLKMHGIRWIRLCSLCKFISPEAIVINLFVILRVHVFLVGLGNWFGFFGPFHQSESRDLMEY